MDLIRALKQISAPLPYEAKKGYTNQSVKGGYTNYAKDKIKKIYLQEQREKIKSLLKLLLIALDEYEKFPQEKTLLNISHQIQSINNQLLQPINFEECQAVLSKPLRYVKGIGPKKEQLLKKMGLNNLWDLIHFFPRDYIDRSKMIPMAYAVHGEQQSFMGKVIGTHEIKKGRLHILKVMARDNTGCINMIIFNQAYQKKYFESRMGQDLMISGKVSRQFQEIQIDNPEYEWMDERINTTIHTARIAPVYRSTEGLYPKVLRTVMHQVLNDHTQAIYDFIPHEILAEEKLPERKEAILQMHFPDNREQLEKSRQRLAFEEFLLGQFSLSQKKELLQKNPAYRFDIPRDVEADFEKLLPYPLTNAQKKVISEIVQDLGQAYPMNRLIHGDVGSGKTTVAGFSLYLAYLNHFQSAFMAPTEILARQCFENFKKIFSSLDIQIELLISDTREKERKRILHALSEGKVNLLVGTHALIQHGVNFHSLGQVVVDEQHRFGVRQRLELRKKGKIPHLLVMSATPIPRTLALTRYGDLDVSLINEMPLGEKKIKTSLLLYQHLPRLYAFVKDQLQKGGKVFVVCPLIDESEKMDLSSSIARHEELKKAFEGFTVLLLHGKMNAKEKESIMSQFASPKGHILVSTTVIEVGIDIPDANIMIIENADRFGLAQLHQLRGRIGRKSQQAYCYLLVKNKENIYRLKVLEASLSGFVVAEKDLEQRGPGELWGAQQSGYIMQSVIQLEKDGRWLEKAKNYATALVKQENQALLFSKELAFRGRRSPAEDMTESG